MEQPKAMMKTNRANMKATVMKTTHNYQSVNPYDGKVLKTFKELTDQQLEKALKTAATCFESWRHTTFAARAAVTAKAAAITRPGQQRTCRSAASRTPATGANFPAWASRSS